MNFIKKIVDGKRDELVHLQFQKFSRGEFKDKAVVEVKKSKDKYTIKTSAEFANELVRAMALKLGNEKTKVTGAIVSTLDLKGELEFKNVKQFQGVKRYLIDSEISGNEIINLLNKFPKNFFALSFSVGDNVLKIKPKAPKSGKPGKGDSDGPKADFCSLKTNDALIGESFSFGIEKNFKQAKFNHIFVIEKIEVPEEIKDSKDFALIREKSLRVGKIIQNKEIDGVKDKKEFEFKA
jgi:hypothetical protein